MAHWTREVLLNRIKAIRVYGAAGKHAPHKPLLLLLALARVQRGESRWYPFALAETELGDLLRRHNPTGRATPEYPFWRLKNDGPQGSAPKDRLWTIRGDDTIREALERGARDVSRAGLLRGAAEGGFPEELQAFLAAHPSVVNDAVELILEQHFRSWYEFVKHGEKRGSFIPI